MADLLRQDTDRTQRLRALLNDPEPVLAPGAYDAFTARLVEEAGFPAVYMTGFGTAASRLGRPDVGLLTMTEMVDNAARIADAVDVPVVADADTGYGNPVSVIRTVREYERAGVSGIHIEDQQFPKRCGHMEDKRVIEADDMVEKVRAAVAARRDDDFLIIARTDARAPLGLDAALDRAGRYRDAGADALFVEALQSDEELKAAADAFPDTPLVFNWLEGGKTPQVPAERLRELGFAMALFPLATLGAVLGAVRSVLAGIRAQGTPLGELSELPAFEELTGAVGLPEIDRLSQRFASGG